MFNSTHTLLGIAMAKSGLDRRTPHATATAVIASNLPDLDSFTLFADSAAYLEHHRGITHSVFAVPFMAAFVAAVIYRLSLRGRTPATFRGLFGISLIVMMTHPLLDYLNSYGMRPFLPFDDTWIYGDTLFIIDPVLDTILLLGVIASYLLPRRRVVCGVVALVVMVAYIGVRVELRSKALVSLAEFVETIPETTETAILPQMRLSPFRWTGIVESETKLWKLSIDTRTGPRQPVLEIDKIPDSVATVKAAQADTAAALLDFARFPFMREEKMEDGYRVYFVDFRFFNQGNGLASAVVLDGNLNILSDDWDFNRQVEVE